LNEITAAVTRIPEIKRITEELSKKNISGEISGLSAVHKAHIAAAIASVRKVLILCADEACARKFASDIEGFEKLGVSLLPSRDFFFGNAEGASREWEQARLCAIAAALKGKARVTVAPVDALLSRAMPRDAFECAAFEIDSKKTYDLNVLSEKLIFAGYARAAAVEGAGQFSVRGGILDVFPPGEKMPVRIEFFGDEIDSMAFFDPDTQRRGKRTAKVSVFPAREVPALFGKNAGKALSDALSKLLSEKPGKTPSLRKILEEDIERIGAGAALPCADRYFDFIYPEFSTAADYFGDDTVVLFDDFSRVRESARGFSARMREDISSAIESGFLYGKRAAFFEEFPAFLARCERFSRISLDTFLPSKIDFPIDFVTSIQAKQLPAYAGSLDTAAADINHYREMGYPVIVTSESPLRAKALSDALFSRAIPAKICEGDAVIPPAGSVLIAVSSLSAGFEYPAIPLALISEGQIVAVAPKKRRISRSKQAGDRIKAYSDLVPGDLVVHEVHGIGRFVGIERIQTSGIERDYIKIAFLGTDFLYVPAISLDLVRKYTGAPEGANIKLSKLGGSDFARAKLRARAAAKALAVDLIALYSARREQTGFSFPEDDAWQREFEEAFEFDETDDQLKCADEIKKDMRSPFPMDRLLCGDVGFGKTEVAFRAIMKCMLGGKQAALLAPTTVLARQHFLTAKKRFEGYPVKMALLSRFSRPKERAETLRRLKSGGIDLVIGTHSLIQKNVEFRDLGLLIVDEEQRFGVSHKERLKELSVGVDVLTLTATPIPRTLNMALSGIRDMSVIEEAPRDRKPVQTFVLEFDAGTIDDAIRREIARNGQVYYLHNRVEDIESCASRLSERFPQCTVRCAHGRMTEDEISDVMTDMVDGRIDILVCTTIIETGIDIPNVNTLIIERADTMGLAQLHQIRGRVGRSPRRAFAYFTFERGKVLSDVAQRRLSAIREFAEFGAGFKIAMRDLEIRGAGNILGAEQSGHIMNVGYDMYIKLLDEAVREEKGLPPKEENACTADLSVSANIPKSFVPDAGQRIDLYRRIAMIDGEDAYRDMTDEICDRFGDPPETVMALLDIALLRSRAKTARIRDISQKDGSIIFTFSDADLEKISALFSMKEFKGRILLSAGQSPYIAVRLREGDAPIALSSAVVKALLD